ncbi:MAG: class C sortase [Clostridiales bacterium]|nr:class C sortase [Clostridiales bacterium]
MKKKASTIGILLLFLIGCAILIYPIVSDYWNFTHQSRTAVLYKEASGDMEGKDYDRILKKAQEYNESLLTRADRFHSTDEEHNDYQTQLVIGHTDVMAVLEIPCIHVFLPIYHGTGDDALQSGVGHLEGSSLPIGGIGTHAVLSGHRGLPSSKLFSDLNKMEIGDRFMIHVLEHVLIYEVDQIQVVLPTEMKSFGLEEDEDYITLLTCTPYGINTHRLLVRGYHVDTLTEEESRRGGISDTGYAWKPDVSEIAALIMALLLFVMLMAVLRKPMEKQQKERSE